MIAFQKGDVLTLPQEKWQREQEQKAKEARDLEKDKACHDFYPF